MIEKKGKMLEVIFNKLFSMMLLVLLVLLVGVWNFLFRHRTCLGVFTNTGVLLLGSGVIWMYPAGEFLCDVCSISYFVPYVILPFLIFSSYCQLFLLLKK